MRIRPEPRTCSRCGARRLHNRNKTGVCQYCFGKDRAARKSPTVEERRARLLEFYGHYPEVLEDMAEDAITITGSCRAHAMKKEEIAPIIAAAMFELLEQRGLFIGVALQLQLKRKSK